MFFDRLGEMRDRSHEDQMHRPGDLNVLSAAIAPWNTVYVESAVEEFRGRGVEITDERLSNPHPSDGSTSRSPVATAETSKAPTVAVCARCVFSEPAHASQQLADTRYAMLMFATFLS